MILDSVQVLFLKKLPFFFGARFFFLQFLSGAGFPAGAAEIETSDGADFPIANTSGVGLQAKSPGKGGRQMLGHCRGSRR